jgi:phosphonate metabolism protein PhnN/1,5-bisphosphokinase (PRPP-forming)
MQAGPLVLVVGPSGAGKDTLIGMAREVLADDRRFLFPRRHVTRASDSNEPVEERTPEAFRREQAAGGFALSWEAHGQLYGVPRGIEAALAEGKAVVVNVSRSVVAEALANHPRVVAVLVTAPAAVLAARLKQRGRESDDDIAARVTREAAPLPSAMTVIAIENDGVLAVAARRFIAALRQIAAAGAGGV